jgi:hypothetical protein
MRGGQRERGSGYDHRLQDFGDVDLIDLPNSAWPVATTRLSFGDNLAAFTANIRATDHSSARGWIPAMVLIEG